MHEAIFDHFEQESSNIFSFYFRPSDHFDYTAGQFIEMYIKHNHPDNRGIKRWFTLSSPPDNELFSITTRIDQTLSSSFKIALTKLKKGQAVQISEPMGDFVMPKLLQTPLVFVAGGIGITPYHSMLAWLKQTSEERPIRLIYGVRNEDDIIFDELLRESEIDLNIIVANPSDSWGGEQGKLSTELILGLSKPSDQSLIYVAGPEPMVEALEADFHKAGIKKQQLILDFFPNYPQE